MIISKNIPLTVNTFFLRVQSDYRQGLFSPDYRALLERETRVRYPGLVEGLSEPIRGRRQIRVIADADHIIPRSLWPILMPLGWNLPGAPPPTPDVLSNLFWRTVTCNRGSEQRGEALDQRDIRRILAASQPERTPQWARQQILAFLRHKHDEGVNIDMPLDPARIDQMTSGADIAVVIDFIQSLRLRQPGVSAEAIAEAVEKKFPQIAIEIDARGPRISIG